PHRGVEGGKELLLLDEAAGVGGGNGAARVGGAGFRGPGGHGVGEGGGGEAGGHHEAVVAAAADANDVGDLAGGKAMGSRRGNHGHVVGVSPGGGGDFSGGAGGDDVGEVAD